MAYTSIVEEHATRRQEMCKSAFVKNIKTHRSSGLKSSSKSLNRHSSSMTADSPDETIDRIMSSSESGSSSTMSSTQSSSLKEQHQQPQPRGFREDYLLGETCRSSCDMIIETTPLHAIRAVSSLKIHDFAFVKRRDDSYSYAIVASRSEASLTFLMCDEGSSKNVSKKRWSEMVRLVSISGGIYSTLPKRASNSNEKQELYHPHKRESILAESYRKNLIKKELSVPTCISIPTRCSHDGDCSVVSEVSLPRCFR